MRVEVIEAGRVVLEPATVDVLELMGMLAKPAKPLALADMKRVIRERAGMKGPDARRLSPLTERTQAWRRSHGFEAG